MARRASFILLVLLPPASAAVLESPVAHYTFAAGEGATLADSIGNTSGIITGAMWTQSDVGAALHFDGQGDFVDLGPAPTLKHPGDMTILAWVRLEASPYPDEMTNWTVVDCEEYRKEGFILRVDGATAKLMYRSSQPGADQAGFGFTALKNDHTYLVGVVRRGSTATLYVDGSPDGQFTVQPPGSGPVPLKISSPGQSFSGAMFDLVFYNRALSSGEIASLYWDQASGYGKDLSGRGTIQLKPYIYYDTHQALLQADFFGLQPLRNGEEAVLELVGPDGKVLQTVQKPVPENSRITQAFDFDVSRVGTYQLEATVTGSDRQVKASAPFTCPPSPIEVPAPEDMTVGPLPVAPTAPAFVVHVYESGGLRLECGNNVFEVSSSFSFPHGGLNLLVPPSSLRVEEEPEWRVSIAHTAPSVWHVQGQGQYFRLDRRVTVRPGRVSVGDTYTNLGDEPLGIRFRNRVAWESGSKSHVLLAGKRVTREVSGRDIKACPTAFAASDGRGLGLIALDDVSIVQAQGDYDGSSMAIGSDEFALGPGASYRAEWAIYGNETGDYYDFVNAVRRDEGRNSVTVDGSLAFIQGTQQKRAVELSPKTDYFTLRNAAYATLYCLSWCTDDPSISVEGIEFTAYPEECAQIRGMMEAMYTERPGLYGMFHVAPQLYATNRPEKMFPDSCVIDAEGNHTVYGYDYANGSYFSQERYADNWRWWIYYPTLDNSFGKALLDSVDTMMDGMGCRGVFVDGFLWGYGGLYTYDRWDGHSADIDPATKTITRTKGSVLLLTQDAMIAYSDKVWAKGGVVIANNIVPTRTLCRQPLIVDREVNEGPEVHLAPTPVTLGNPAVIQTDEDLYHDVLNKLRAGNLYFFYGDPKELSYEPLPARMYPITVEEVHSGYIKGKERLVTLHNGVYGWAGSRDLHRAYRYDARGHRVQPDFVTTIDRTSVRTRIDLDPDEAAVLERIPVQLEANAPVNVIVTGYEAGRVTMRINGSAAVDVRMADGTVHHLDIQGPRDVQLP